MYLLLLLLWFIFNGRVTLEVALFGIVICGWLYWFICKYMGYSFQREKVLVKKIPLYLKYAFVLLWEIFKANVDVIKIIFSPKKAEIQPALVRFHTDLKSSRWHPRSLLEHLQTGLFLRSCALSSQQHASSMGD